MDCVESAMNAERGNASRIELCANLSQGGTTPSVGLLRVVKRQVQIPVFVMIRPRGGDFLYSKQELLVMKEDLRAAKENGADGIVFGILQANGAVDQENCAELIALADPLPVTFHRAFDMTSNVEEALQSLIDLHFTRVLTSGQASTAVEGLPLLKRLVTQAAGRIVVMPGAGISEENVEKILSESGAREFHGSARVSRCSRMKYRNQSVSMGSKPGEEYSLHVADEVRVQRMVEIASRVWICN